MSGTKHDASVRASKEAARAEYARHVANTIIKTTGISTDHAQVIIAILLKAL